LVKTASDPTVYYINSKGIKKSIPTLELFLSYGNSFANVKTIDQAQLDGFPLFQAITLVSGDGRVWTLDMVNRTRHWVRDLTVFEELGLEWDRVVEVNQTEFEYYAEGGEAGECPSSASEPLPGLNYGCDENRTSIWSVARKRSSCGTTYCRQST
jgi:hypothetical protein